MMVLHGSGGSPYVTRVLIQAAAKNLDLELRPANLADPECRRMNPIGKDARPRARRVEREH